MKDAPDVGVQAIADRNVDEPIAAANRHGRLRSLFGQGEQAGALSAAQDDGQYFAHAGQSTKSA
jgi:hypothetical protein